MEKYYVNPIGRIRVRGEEMWIQLDQKLTAALKVHPDIIRALLEEGRLYTVSEAEEVINRYMTRKV